ncbi:hypothetical protein SDRG_02010 [Saprolegnia diclina VS20]|uniref:Amino acid transporter n=1 Tax=Saprolegnia diclina (strain VS20) TaxID=1156394 RepID=T0SDD6_SAPDV|nr:hypothetical protein SDRG_02010 [Saprolegnia diclina VS20]EQC40947.1 hypothetical protein SDRG_02010 [Saprolegnia diclina VS20]|eukprot:XP_008605791.1 hypothetical protein SDRG_02010 [Saprolegnia diclina VS20]
MDQQPKGILLFTNDQLQGSRAPSYHSAPSSDGQRARRIAPPAEPLGVRTNFTSGKALTDSIPMTSYENYDDPIMEEDKNLHAAGDFDARSTSTYVNSIYVLIGAAVGAGIGLALTKADISRDVQQWIQMPGDLFVRALRCLVVPMVFASMSVVIAEVVVLKKTSILSWRTGAIFFFTSFIATVQGLLLSTVYRGIFEGGTNSTSTSALPSPVLAFRCANGLFLNQQTNGSLLCDKMTNDTATTLFTTVDINNMLTVKSTITQLSLTQQIISIIELTVPDNIFNALTQGSLLSVIMFALPLGYAIAKSHNGPATENGLLNVFRQTRNSLLILINAVLMLTPIAVGFLICSAIISYQANASAIFSQAGYLILMFLAGVFCHVMLVMPLILFLFTRCNPYNYMRQLFPAYVFAQLGAPQMAVLFFVSLLGCVGTAPIPQAGLAMLMTVWRTTLPNEDLPHAFVYVVAIDFLIDRINTMVNINGNMIITRILADQFDETVETWATDNMN